MQSSKVKFRGFIAEYNSCPEYLSSWVSYSVILFNANRESLNTGQIDDKYNIPSFQEISGNHVYGAQIIIFYSK